MPHTIEIYLQLQVLSTLHKAKWKVSIPAKYYFFFFWWILQVTTWVNIKLPLQSPRDNAQSHSFEYMAMVKLNIPKNRNMESA